LVTGELGSLQDQESCAKISRVIIAGNSLSQCTQTKDSETKVINQYTFSQRNKFMVELKMLLFTIQ